MILCLAFHWGANNKIKYPSTLLKAAFGGTATILGVTFVCKTMRGALIFMEE